MKDGNWIPVDKRIFALFPKDRPYTDAEAYLSLRIDLDDNSPKGLREYARIWKWSIGKMQRFFKKLNYKTGDTLSDTEAIQKRYRSDTRIRIVFNSLKQVNDTKARQSRDKSETILGHNCNPLNPKPNPKEKDKNILSEFEKIWKEYPNKDGKKKAESHFKASVKTEQDLQDIWKALENYKKSRRVKEGYIKNGSTWFNNWQDWLNYVESTNNSPKRSAELSEDEILAILKGENDD